MPYYSHTISCQTISCYIIMPYTMPCCTLPYTMPRSWWQVWHDVKSKYWLTKQSLKLHTPPARGALRSCQTKFATKCKYQICFLLKLLRCRSNPVNWLHSSSSVTSSCFSGFFNSWFEYLNVLCEYVWQRCDVTTYISIFRSPSRTIWSKI